MARLELSVEESALLSEIFESYLSDLKTERVHTDNRGMREDLKAKEAFLDRLLKQLIA